MTPGPDPAATENAAAPRDARGKSIGWQLAQVAVLLGLLVLGMYEVDLDARALAEARARTALESAVDDAAKRPRGASPNSDLERSIEAYAKVCAECATRERCESMGRAIRAGEKLAEGKGPCEEGIFQRWSAGDARQGGR
jgi:hypothetical protein